ncbi:MAG: SDR family oxidoreductase [Gammaproteobacteria bacterium]|nr:SDR family oxidoreductase [Gammaproteobacteria bacterium]
MKLIIFGASGSVGHKLVEQALAQGHQVTAFIRDKSKLQINASNLQIAVGDVLQIETVELAIKRQDAVLCVLGAGRKGTVRSEGTRNIIQAMETTGVKRLICQSSLGVGDSRGNLNLFWKYFMFGLLLRPAYEDHARQEQYVRQSELDWTIVRPGAFTDGVHTGQYRHGFSSQDKTTRLKISRSDVADFLLKQLFDSTYLHKAASLSY